MLFGNEILGLGRLRFDTTSSSVGIAGLFDDFHDCRIDQFECFGDRLPLWICCFLLRCGFARRSYFADLIAES